MSGRLLAVDRCSCGSHNATPPNPPFLRGGNNGTRLTRLVTFLAITGFIMLAGKSVRARQTSPKAEVQKVLPVVDGDASKSAANVPEPGVERRGSATKAAVDRSSVLRLVL
jgi:hypothetical protein